MNALVLKLAILCGPALWLFSSLKGDEALNPVPAHQAQVREKLNTIYVSIDLKNASIRQAIEALATSSKKADPDSRGIGFYIQSDSDRPGKPITLKLEHVPAGVALRYVCELSEHNYKIDDHFVNILPLDFGDKDLSKETFHVDPSFLETARQNGATPPRISP